MEKIIPYFELNGKRYEIKKTRFLMAQYDKLREENLTTEANRASVIKSQKALDEFNELSEKYEEIKKAHFSDITNKELTEQYKAFKEEYNAAAEEVIKIQSQDDGVMALQKKIVDTLEKIAILGIAEQYFGYGKDGIMAKEAYDKAQEVWCEYVDEVGKNTASEWLMAMSDCLFTNIDEGAEENNSFLQAMRARKNRPSR